MQLIIATQAFADVPLRRISGGYQAELAGPALKHLVDASFGGASIEVLEHDRTPQALNVTEIQMAGRTTRVTLMSCGAKQLH
ncbi:hypothetical protein BFP70_11145 [Thioclava sp. SK-1]|uniref:hypothetical protein n=1 Tax=Thioclava sp. SK-1 TaxID=1889770 RepID=UPI000826DF19|nr:hypothetical protein [Thioclava sp. SK-1]OCX64580.1 hypothetical protein BFP70_11145 [Thioclava sp. SK-1]